MGIKSVTAGQPSSLLGALAQDGAGPCSKSNHLPLQQTIAIARLSLFDNTLTPPLLCTLWFNLLIQLSIWNNRTFCLARNFLDLAAAKYVLRQRAAR